MKKQFVSPNDVYRRSQQMAMEIVKSGFKPTWLLALWRGGTPVGINIHEILVRSGLKVDHIAIRTSVYTGIDTVSEEKEERKKAKVRVHCLEYFLKKAKKEDRVLLVDDVFDRGISMQAVLQKIKRKLPEERCPPDLNFKIATLFWKPEKNQTDPHIAPHYFTDKVDKDTWLVFGHELSDLTLDEIASFYGQGLAYFFMGLPK